MRRGFTLVELLVVLAVVAILAAILFPVFAQAKRAAKTTTTLSYLRQLGAAYALYEGDADDVPPPSAEGWEGEGKEGGWLFIEEFGLEDEAGRFDVRRGVLYPYVKNDAVYQAPLDPDAAKARDSFAFNGCLIVPPFRYGLNPSLPTTSVARPAETMLLGEETVGQNGGTNDGFFYPGVDRLAPRHAGGSALLFADAHAKVLKGDLRRLVDGGDKPCWPGP